MFLLFKIHIEKNDNLPSFIDRGKEINILNMLNLTKYAQPSKHQHYKPINLTKSGQDICKKLSDDGFFLRCNDINLEKKIYFDQSFQILYLTPKSYQESYDNNEILSDLGLPSIGKELIQGKVSLTILGWKKYNIENKEIYDFKLRVICKRCKNSFEFSQRIQFFEENYDLNRFIKNCPDCNLTFYCDRYFSSFSMYES